jgi:hypothetical protein
VGGWVAISSSGLTWIYLRRKSGPTEYAAPLGLGLFLLFGSTTISRRWRWGWEAIRADLVW